MPRRKSEEINPDWKYSSVTLPKEFIYYLDQIIMEVAKFEATGGTGTFLPSRRAIVQDAVEMYITEIYPDLKEEYIEMLKDCGMHQKTGALAEWQVKQAILKKTVAEKTEAPKKDLSKKKVPKKTESKRVVIEPVLTCPHCNKSGRKSTMTRYHFHNCKFIKSVG